ncbi:MAG: hypothetical protein IIB60_01055 [Planctomycetes bacterium]|nr:hypothetical protein [Planctomycetota bacterium]
MLWTVTYASGQVFPLAPGDSPHEVSRADPGELEAGKTETIEVDLKLRTGGSLRGLVVDHTSEAIVVVQGATPYVFAWAEVKTPSAYRAKRDLIALQRGGRDHLLAEDHYRLGLFALSRGRRALASTEFRKASRLDREYEELARSAFAASRKAKPDKPDQANPLNGDAQTDTTGGVTEPGLAQRMGGGLGGDLGSTAGVPPNVQAKIVEIYRAFGETVKATIYKNLVLIETDHFLIWTDWGRRDRKQLGEWAEAMYAALGRQFDLDPSEQVFLAKCPLFCWRSAARFRKFARRFDGFTGEDAVGYTRSIAENGHVHMVLLRQGNTRADRDRFAGTLVHEGTHAFLHRLYSTRLIPHWVNEGYADLIAARVLKERCYNDEKAALLARQYVRYDWPIGHLLSDAGPIGVHEYPLAQSVVAHLESRGRERFARFIKGLKEGQTLVEAVATSYDGQTLDQLEASWREAVRRGDPSASIQRD